MHHLSFVVILAGIAAGLAAQEGAPKKPDPKPAAAKSGDAGVAAESKAKELTLGSRANRDLVLKDIDGKEHRARDYQGKITVVNFFSIQCPVQAAYDRRLADLQEEFSKQGVVFLHIDANVTEIGKAPPKASEDEPAYDDIRQHLKGKDLPFTVLVDHGNVVADAFGAKTTPDVFVFGKDGKLVYRGLVDDDQRDAKGDKAKRYVHDVLGKLCADEKVEPSQTTPVGCNIKRVPKPKAKAAEGTEGKRSGG